MWFLLGNKAAWMSCFLKKKTKKTFNIFVIWNCWILHKGHSINNDCLQNMQRQDLLGLATKKECAESQITQRAHINSMAARNMAETNNNNNKFI